jgi:hypothetical protein
MRHSLTMPQVSFQLKHRIDNGGAIFAKAFMSIPTQQATKTKQLLMPATAASPAECQIHILAMTRHDA